MSRKRRLHAGHNTDLVTAMAWLFALALLGVMFWMASTAQRFCCDAKSLVGQLMKV
jgi:hypothetical protein